MHKSWYPRAALNNFHVTLKKMAFYFVFLLNTTSFHLRVDHYLFLEKVRKIRGLICGDVAENTCLGHTEKPPSRPLPLRALVFSDMRPVP
jgi:hypothetical protein|eukprot:COSAG01_NODE_168_length_23206_cov_14.301467_6_plen_90_part_00